MNPTEAVSREQLYEAVWSKPATHLAAQFGVSDSFLARICKRLRVPRPQPGYWAKLAADKAPPRPALPPIEPGDETHWQPPSPLPAQHHTQPQQTALAHDSPPGKVAETTLAEEPKEETSTAQPAVSSAPAAVPTTRKGVRRRVPATHPLIEGLTGLIPQGRVTEEGLYRPRKRLLPDIITSEKQLETIVRLGNKIYRHLESCGHRVRISNISGGLHRTDIDPCPVSKKQGGYYHSLWHPERPTVVYIDETPIGLSLFETLREQEMQYIHGEYVPVSTVSAASKQRLGWATWSTTRLVPSGEFCLQAYAPYQSTNWVQQWRGSSSKLAAQLDEITQTLQHAVPVINALVEEARRAAEKWRREWDESMERQRREEQAKRMAKAIEAARTELLAIIDDWSQYQRVAAFFEEILEQSQDIPQEARMQIMSKLAAAQKLFGGADTLARLAQWTPPEEPDLTPDSHKD